MSNNPLKTKDYAQFKALTGNRAIDSSHITKLTRSILKNNMLASNPIIVNEDMCVVDGQHRLDVARYNDLEIYYIVHSSTDIEDVLLLNANSRSWKLTDYLKSYIDLGKEDYKYLKDFCDKYNFQFGFGLRLLRKSNGATRTGIAEFKAGKFVADNKEFAIETAEHIEAYRRFTENDVHRDRNFLGAILRFSVYKLVDHEEMLKKLKERDVKIERQGNLKQYLREFEDIFNFRSKHYKTRFTDKGR